MTKSLYRRTATGFAPADEAGQRYWSRFAPGDQVMLTFSHPRSLEQLRLYWALVQVAYENQMDDSQFGSAEEISDAIKLACGATNLTHVKWKGEWFVRKTPKSIAFENMGQEEFSSFFDKALTYLCTELVPGLDVETLKVEIGYIQ